MQSVQLHQDQSGRRKTLKVRVGQVTVGSGAPVVVQSMTNTDTADALSTTQQVKALVFACNTATAVGIRAFRARLSMPIIGIEPAVFPALRRVWPPAAGRHCLRYCGHQ